MAGEKGTTFTFLIHNYVINSSPRSSRTTVSVASHSRVFSQI